MGSLVFYTLFVHASECAHLSCCDKKVREIHDYKLMLNVVNP